MKFFPIYKVEIIRHANNRNVSPLSLRSFDYMIVHHRAWPIEKKNVKYVVFK